jgi:hypothetical protein
MGETIGGIPWQTKLGTPFGNHLCEPPLEYSLCGQPCELPLMEHQIGDALVEHFGGKHTGDSTCRYTFGGPYWENPLRDP